jgi:uncharacterized protein with FMN-binding domain
MKKAILIIGVVGIFVVYSVVLRSQHGKTNGVTTSSALSSGSSSSGSNSGSSGGSTTSSNGSGTTSTTTSSTYKDGTYTGASENAFYGNVQISTTVSGGKITTVDFLSYPNDSPNSQDINSQATVLLKQEALKAQSANVNIVSGATLTSQAFAKSLQSALQQAKA